jgi:M6 family metalloprotease-like protein
MTPVFLSYSHRDEEGLQELLPFLRSLERDGGLRVWVDRTIPAGSRWRQQIESAIAESSIAILLISQDFLASQFIYEEELPRILRRQLEGHLTVFPVFLRPSTVSSDAITFADRDGVSQRITLSEFQGFGTPERTLQELATVERARVFVELHRRILQFVASGNSGAARKHSTVSRPAAIRNLPYPRNLNFTGRESYLRQLEQEFTAGHGNRVIQAISGLGGIGKTQIALEYCYRFDSTYDVIWWIRAEKPDTRIGDLLALGRAVGRIDSSLDEAAAIASTLHWLNGTGRSLLILDNVENPKDVRDILPRGPHCHVIITSRYAAWGAVAKNVKAGVWPSDEAIAYLVRRTGLDDRDTAGAIAEQLGFLPLALAQAGAYVEYTGCGFSRYLERLRAQPAEALRLRPNASEEERAIATIWEIAFEQVAHTSGAALALLNLFSLLHADGIRRDVLVEHSSKLPPVLRDTIGDAFAFDAAVAVLRSYSLVDVVDDRFSIHRLVQIVVRSRLNDADYRLFSEAAKEIEGEQSAGVQSSSQRLHWRTWALSGALAALALLVGWALWIQRQPDGTTADSTESTAEPPVVIEPDRVDYSAKTPGARVVALPKIAPRQSIGILFVLLAIEKGPRPYPRHDIEQLASGSSGSVKSYIAEVSGQKVDSYAVVTDWMPFDAPASDYLDEPKEWLTRFRDALKTLESKVDFASLDRDGDGQVDHVFFVHDTPGAESGQRAKAKIWSSSWNLSAQGVTYTSKQKLNGRPITIDSFSVLSGISTDGKRAPLGQFAHYAAHALGLGEQYLTRGREDATEGAAGKWSLMGAGFEWDKPPHPSGPEKLLLGWVESLDDAVGEIVLPPIQASKKVVVFPLGGSEYLVLENRQPTGFDTAIPGGGLLVWRLQGSKVHLVEADGRLDLARSRNNGEPSDAFPAGSTDSVTVGNVAIRKIRREPNGNLSMQIDRLTTPTTRR